MAKNPPDEQLVYVALNRPQGTKMQIYHRKADTKAG